MMTDDKLFAEWTYHIQESAIRKLLKYQVKYYFGGGLPGALPLEVHSKILIELGQRYQKLLSEGKVDEVLTVFNYGPTAGDAELKQILMQRLVERQHLPFNPETDWDKIMITTGSQEAIYTVLDSMINPGDVVLVPSPGYLGFVGVSDKMGARTVGIPTDEEGLIIDAVRAGIEASKKQYGNYPKLVYVVATSDNPKGSTMGDKRRKELFDLVSEYGIYLIEDDAYKEIQFGKLFEPIKKFDKENERVIYFATTSKEAGVFRLGYSLMPDPVKEQVEKSKGYIDLCTPTLIQKIAAEYYKGPIDVYLKEAIEVYKRRKELMYKLISETFPAGTFTNPTGGFFIWWESEKPDFDSTKFNYEVAIPNEVLFVQGEAFYAPRGYHLNDDLTEIVPMSPKKNGMRLSYSKVPESIIEEGIPLLGKLLKQELE